MFNCAAAYQMYMKNKASQNKDEPVIELSPQEFMDKFGAFQTKVCIALDSHFTDTDGKRYTIK